MFNNRLSHLIDAPDRHEVGLRVKAKPIVDAAIQINRKLWDTCDRVGSYEGGLAGIIHNSSGETQIGLIGYMATVAVMPAVETRLTSASCGTCQRGDREEESAGVKGGRRAAALGAEVVAGPWWQRWRRRQCRPVDA